MNLTVRIHDIEYVNKIAQGATFSEEYNETLDSGAIRICHIGQIDNLRPYDDVYIYDSDYSFDDNIANWRQGGICSDNPFYRHLLINQYTEEVVNLAEGIYSYSIELFSETKGLEMVQVPNISVTQPLNIKKKTDIYTYLCRFVERYSPKYKTIDRNSSPEEENFLWTYTNKYSVSPELKNIFGGVYSQDFTLSNPTLRDVLSTLMITKDMIPYVKDGVIYAKAISERTGTYDIETEKNSGRINLVVGQMSSADYCDGVRRQYSDALSQDGTCNFIEHLGFRNKEASIMTLDNMRLETAHKIYKIKKMNMCYYKKAKVAIFSSTNEKLGEEDMWFLCKQDITPLVKNSIEWNLLSQDWQELDGDSPPQNVSDLSKYKISTVSYNIGGTTIEGWGNRYNQYSTGILSVYDVTKTYIENIYEKLDSFNPFGEADQAELVEQFKAKIEATYPTVENVAISPVAGISALYFPGGNTLFSRVQAMKLIFFEIEYSGFYDGALIHSRDKGNDNFFQNDNQSSSLTLLEKDGFSQKEKLNRFANKTYTMKGRLDGDNYGVDKLLNLGETGIINETDDDVIIYRREYSIYDNYILVSYAGIQDYVLKNFYTSVYAKYRTYQLMSYGESVNRAENKKILLVLSKNKKYTNESDGFFGDKNDTKILLSAFSPSIDDAGTLTDITINSGIFYNNEKSYLTDEHTFVSGKSLCFNLSMPDNISGGNYISKVTADYDFISLMPSKENDYYIGSTQRWYNFVDDSETGFIDSLSIELCHRDFKNEKNVVSYDDLDDIYEHILRYPVLNVNSDTTFAEKKNSIKFNEKVYKDNKERIDFTFQVEPIAERGSGIYFSDYLLKLSDLNSFNKYEEDFYKEGHITGYEIKFSAEYSNYYLTIETIEDVPNELISLVRENGGQYPFYANFVISLSGVGLKNPGQYSYVTFIAENISFSGQADRPFNGMQMTLLGHGSVRGALDGEIQEKDITQITFLYDEDEGKFRFRNSEIDGVSFTALVSSPKTYIVGNSSLEKEKILIRKNMFVEFSDSFVDSSFETKTIYSDKTFSKDYSPSDIFVVQENGILIKSSLAPEGTNSIRFWYFDFDAAYNKNYDGESELYTYSPEQSFFKFVFGVNLDQEAPSEDFMIFVNETKQRDDRVFDSVGRLVGNNFNWAKDLGDESPSDFKYHNSLDIDETGMTKVITEVTPSFGKINGVGSNGEATYFDGETINLEFIPYEKTLEYYGAEFYDWNGTIKEINGEEKSITSTQNPFVEIAKNGRTIDLKARCSIPYNVWSNINLSPLYQISSEPQVIYAFSDYFFGGAGETDFEMAKIVVGGLIAAPLPYVVAATIDANKNNSEDSAVDVSVLGGILSKIVFKMWYEPTLDADGKKIGGKLFSKGFYNVLGYATSFGLRINTIESHVCNRLWKTRLTLDFSDENIKSISVLENKPVTGVNLRTFERTDDSVSNGKLIIEDINYGNELEIWAEVFDAQLYDTEYDSLNHLSVSMGMDMTFAPVTIEFSERRIWEYPSDESEDIGVTLEYKTSSDNIPQLVELSGLVNYLGVAESISSENMRFFLDVSGEEKVVSVTDKFAAISISDGVTIEIRGLMGSSIENSDDTGTLLVYVLRSENADAPVVKLKMITERGA